MYLRKIQQKVFFLKTDPEKEIVSEDPDYYKALEEEEDEGKYIQRFTITTRPGIMKFVSGSDSM